MIRVAVDGTDETTRQAIASRLRGAILEPIGDIGRVDGVAFLSPGQPNSEVVRPLLEAGKHVLVSAPCWPGDILATLAGDGGRLAVVNPDRHLPSRRLLEDEVKAGKLGPVGLVRLHRWGSTPNPTGLVRDLDLAIRLVGEFPDRVYAVTPKAEGFVQVHLGFPRGAMALLDHATCLPPGDGYQSLILLGASGAAYGDDHHNMQLVYRGGRPQAVVTGEGVRQLATLLQDFIDALREGRNLSASVAEWRAVLTVEEAVRRSLDERRAVTLAPGYGGQSA